MEFRDVGIGDWFQFSSDSQIWEKTGDDTAIAIGYAASNTIESSRLVVNVHKGE
jgi:hypothetical protein